MTGIYIAVTFIAPGVLVWAQKYKKHVISTVWSCFPLLTSPLLQRNQRAVGCRRPKTKLDLAMMLAWPMHRWEWDRHRLLPMDILLHQCHVLR